MIIQVNEDYRISTDSLNITVEKKRIIKEDTKHLKAGDEVFDIIGFYGEFEHAYRALLKHGLLTSDLEGLRAIMNWIEKTGKEIKESLSRASLDNYRKIIDELQTEVDRLKKQEGKA
jgi:uncharacterized protein YaaR (DUF327 family)